MWLGLVLVLGAATELDGAASLGVSALNTELSPFVHGRLGVSREFGELTGAARASVLLQLDPRSRLLGATDLGSALDLSLRLRRGWSAGATLFPLNSDLLLPSFDWANRWGRARPNTFSPTLRFSLDTPEFGAWLALRPDVAVDTPGRIAWKQGVLLGGRFRLGDARAAVRGAWFDLGTGASSPLVGNVQRSSSLAASGLVTWVFHEEVRPALDLFTYADDPTRFERFFEVEPARHRLAAQVSLEAGGGAQLLPSSTSNDVAPQGAVYLDLQARVRLAVVRLFATLRVRSTSQLLFDAPSMPPGMLFVEGSTASPLVVGMVGSDVLLWRTGLRLGVFMRLTANAFLRSRGETFYFGERGNLFLGADEVRFALKPTIRWDAGKIGSVVSEVDIVFDARPEVRWVVLGQVRF